MSRALAGALLVLAAWLALAPVERGLRCRYLRVPRPGATELRLVRPGLLRHQHADFALRHPVAAGLEPRPHQPGPLEPPGSHRWTGWIHAPVEGTYGFGTRSDDDSAVIVDGRLVAVNWGRHPPRTHSGRTWLTRGFHRLRLDWIQAGGPGELQFYWRRPGGEVEHVPADVLFTTREPSRGDEVPVLAGTHPWELIPPRAPEVIVPPWAGIAAGSPGEPASRPAWAWADVWGAPVADPARFARPSGGALVWGAETHLEGLFDHRFESVLSAGTGRAPACAGERPADALAGTWRVWRARLDVPWSVHVRVRRTAPAGARLWLDGRPVLGGAAPARFGEVAERLLPAGQHVLSAVTPACEGPVPAFELEPVDHGGPPSALVPRPDPVLVPRIEMPHEVYAEEAHDRIWFTDETRLLARPVYHHDAERDGPPTAPDPLAASWDGTLHVPADGVWQLQVRGGGAAWLALGAHRLYKSVGAQQAVLLADLQAGPHALRLDVHDPAVVRQLTLSWRRVDGPASARWQIIGPGHLRAPDALSRRIVRAFLAGLALLGAALLIGSAGGIGGYAHWAIERAGAHAWVLLVLLGLAVRLHDHATVPAQGDTEDELNYHMVGMSLLAGEAPVGWTWMDGFPVAAMVPLHGRIFRLVAPMVAYPPLFSVAIGAVNRAAGARSALDVRLHATRLVPVAASVLALALVAPVARALALPAGTGLAATAFLAVFPLAAVQARLIKEENLLAPLLLIVLWLIARYDPARGAASRAGVALAIVASVLAKPMGAAAGVLAVAGFAARGHRAAAVHAGFATILGAALHIWFGLAWGGACFPEQLARIAASAPRLDALTPLATRATVTGYSVGDGWLAGLWILLAATALRKGPGPRLLALAAASYTLVTVYAYPSEYNWGWYKIPLWPLFALGFGAQAAQLLRRADPLRALLFAGLFLLPALEVMGRLTPLGPEAIQIAPYHGFLDPAHPTPVRAKTILALVLALAVGPAMLAPLMPRGLRRPLASAAMVALSLAILLAMLAAAWHWDILVPGRFPGDPCPVGVYENQP